MKGDPKGSKGKAPRRKVLAFTGGGGAGLEAGRLLVYAFEQATRHDLPYRIEGSAVGLIALALGFLVAYLVPGEPGED